jgi:hypothetical protein
VAEASGVFSNTLSRKQALHLLNNLAWSRIPETICIDDPTPLDINTKFAEPSSFEVNL